MKIHPIVPLALLVGLPLLAIAQNPEQGQGRQGGQQSTQQQLQQQFQQQQQQPALPAPNDPRFAEMISYAIGRSVAQESQIVGLKINPQAFQAGVADVENNAQARYTDQQLGQAMQQFTQMIQQAIDKQTKEEGEAFLAKNATQPGVKTTASGLQYKVLREGDGPSPTPNDTVVCHYRGTFINGEEFDSSYHTGRPAQFPVTRVIAGWTEALQLMKVGDKFQLFVPYQLAYDEEGRPGIPPYSALVFEVELINISQGGGAQPR